MNDLSNTFTFTYLKFSNNQFLVLNKICFRFNLDPSWSETGDRYMLKLFRDYLFHQVTEEGRPWLDMAHIVQTLNKLDSGSSDTVNYFAKFFVKINEYLFFYKIQIF